MTPWFQQLLIKKVVLNEKIAPVIRCDARLAFHLLHLVRLVKENLTKEDILRVATLYGFVLGDLPHLALRLNELFSSVSHASWCHIILEFKNPNIFFLPFMIFCWENSKQAPLSELNAYFSIQLKSSIENKINPLTMMQYSNFSVFFSNVRYVQDELFQAILFKGLLRAPEVALSWIEFILSRCSNLTILPADFILMLGFLKSSDDYLKQSTQKVLNVMIKFQHDPSTLIEYVKETQKYLTSIRPTPDLKNLILFCLSEFFNTFDFASSAARELQSLMNDLLLKESNELAIFYLLKIYFACTYQFDESSLKLTEALFKADKMLVKEYYFNALLLANHLKVELPAALVFFESIFKKLSMTEGFVIAASLCSVFLSKTTRDSFFKGFPQKERTFVKGAVLPHHSNMCIKMVQKLAVSEELDNLNVYLSACWSVWNSAATRSQILLECYINLPEKSQTVFRQSMATFLDHKTSISEKLFTGLISAIPLKTDADKLKLFPCLFKLNTASSNTAKALSMKIFDEEFVERNQSKLLNIWLKLSDNRSDLSSIVSSFLLDQSDNIPILKDYLFSLLKDLLDLAMKVTTKELEEWRISKVTKKPILPLSLSKFFGFLEQSVLIIEEFLGSQGFIMDSVTPLIYDYLLPLLEVSKVFKESRFDVGKWLLLASETFSKAYGCKYPWKPVQSVIFYLNEEEILPENYWKDVAHETLGTPFYMIHLGKNNNDNSNSTTLLPFLQAVCQDGFTLKKLPENLLLKLIQFIFEADVSLLPKFCENLALQNTTSGSLDMDEEILPYQKNIYVGPISLKIGDYLYERVLLPEYCDVILECLTIVGPNSITNELGLEWALIVLSRYPATHSQATKYLDSLPVRKLESTQFVAVLLEFFKKNEALVEEPFVEAFSDFVNTRVIHGTVIKSLLEFAYNTLKGYLEAPKHLKDRALKDLIDASENTRKRLLNCLGGLIKREGANEYLEEEIFLEFINKVGLLDPTLSDQWLKFGVALIRNSSAKKSDSLYCLIESFMDYQPNVNSANAVAVNDTLQMANSIFLGTLGVHLPLDKTQLLIDKLMTGLEVPSEIVQLAIAQTLVPLAEKVKTGVVETYTRDLLGKIFREDVSFAQRKGYAYGAGAFLLAQGIYSVKQYSVIALIQNKVSAECRPFEKLGALFLMEACILFLGVLFEPYLECLLPLLLSLYSDTDQGVKDVAIQDTSKVLIEKISPNALAKLLPSVLDQLGDGKSSGITGPTNISSASGGKLWRRKLSCVKLLAALGHLPGAAFVRLIPLVIPPLLEHVLTDSHPMVAKAGLDALTQIFTLNPLLQQETPEMARLLPVILLALSDPNGHLARALDTLGKCVFSHTISIPGLALVTPLLVRGLIERSSEIKRRTCLIIGNMVLLSPHLNDVRRQWKVTGLLDTLRSVLTDPVPDTRDMAAQVMGVLVHTLGSASFSLKQDYKEELDSALLARTTTESSHSNPFITDLLDELRMNPSRVDRVGLAKGLVHSLFALGPQNLAPFIENTLIPLQQQLYLPRSTFDVDAALVVFQCLPAIFGLYVVPHLSLILPSLIGIFSGEITGGGSNTKTASKKSTKFVSNTNSLFSDDTVSLAQEAFTIYVKEYALLAYVKILISYGHARFYLLDELDESTENEETAEVNESHVNTYSVTKEFLLAMMRLWLSTETDAKFQGLLLLQNFLEVRFPFEDSSYSKTSQMGGGSSSSEMVVSPTQYLSPLGNSRIAQIQSLLQSVASESKLNNSNIYLLTYSTFLARLYLLRFDPTSQPLRQLALVMWKSIVEHTPRTLKNYLDLILDMLEIQKDISYMEGNSSKIDGSSSEVYGTYSEVWIRRAIQDLFLKLGSSQEASFFSYIEKSCLGSSSGTVTVRPVIYLILQEWILLQQKDHHALSLPVADKKTEKLLTFTAASNSELQPTKLPWLLKFLSMNQNYHHTCYHYQTINCLYVKLAELFDKSLAFQNSYAVLLSTSDTNEYAIALKETLSLDPILYSTQLVPFLVNTLTIVGSNSCPSQLLAVIEQVPFEQRGSLQLDQLAVFLLTTTSPNNNDNLLIWTVLLSKQDVNIFEDEESAISYYQYNADYLQLLFTAPPSLQKKNWNVVEILLETFLTHPTLVAELPLKTTAAKRSNNIPDRVPFSLMKWGNCSTVLTHLILTMQKASISEKQFEKLLVSTLTLLIKGEPRNSASVSRDSIDLHGIINLLSALLGYLKKFGGELGCLESQLAFLFFLLEDYFDFPSNQERILAQVPTLLHSFIPLMTHLLTIHTALDEDVLVRAVSLLTDAIDGGSLAPNMAMMIVGPFIRCLSERIPPTLRSCILSALLLLCGEQYLFSTIKPFVPQLQRCFCKSLVVPIDAPSPVHFLTSSLIPHTALKSLLLISVAIPKPDLLLPDLVIFLETALFPVMDTLNIQAMRNEETYVDPDLVSLSLNFVSLIQNLSLRDPSILEKSDSLKNLLALLQKMPIIEI